MEKLTLVAVIISNPFFKWTVGATLTTLTGVAITSIRNTNKKIRNAPTKDDLDKIKCDAFKYTDAKMKIHEDLQLLEISSIKDKITETHSMVKLLHEIAIKKGSN